MPREHLNQRQDSNCLSTRHCSVKSLRFRHGTHTYQDRGVLDELVAFVLWPHALFAFAIHRNSFCHETFSSFSTESQTYLNEWYQKELSMSLPCTVVATRFRIPRSCRCLWTRNKMSCVTSATGWRHKKSFLWRQPLADVIKRVFCDVSHWLTS
jgi:hypothetical protein